MIINLTIAAVSLPGMVYLVSGAFHWPAIIKSELLLAAGYFWGLFLLKFQSDNWDEKRCINKKLDEKDY